MIKMHRNFKAFTIIELMVGIFVTIAVIGTFFKLYTNSVKAQRVTNIRSSVVLVGDQMVDSIANSIRLLGLDNVYSDFGSGAGVPGTIILNSTGSDGEDSVTFQFLSPYGGPIAQLYSDASGAGACVFNVRKSSSAAFHTGLLSVNLMSNSGIFRGTVASITETTVSGETVYQVATSAVVDSAGSPLSTACPVAFPRGTLITGPNNNYVLNYVKSGTNTLLRLNNTTTGENIIDFNSTANSAISIPFFVIQFLREYIDAAGKMRREWETSINATFSPDSLKEVKAIRVGFVLVSNVDRTKKKIATAGMSTTVQYCPFENMCYDLNDINKTAFVFRRVIHIKNFDYLKRASEIVY